jgi:hypothetical protein
MKAVFLALFLPVFSLQQTVPPARATAKAAPPLPRVVLIVNADEPLRSRIIDAWRNSFAQFKEVSLFVYEDKWPLAEPVWSISVVANETTVEGKKEAGFVMATAFVKPISTYEREPLLAQLSQYECVPRSVVKNAVGGRAVAVSDLRSMFVTSGNDLSELQSTVKEAFGVLRTRFLDAEVARARSKR